MECHIWMNNMVILFNQRMIHGPPLAEHEAMLYLSCCNALEMSAKMFSQSIAEHLKNQDNEE